MSNQTPKYSIGQEVYCVVENGIHKGKIVGYDPIDKYYRIQVDAISIYPCNRVVEQSIYATKFAIIKDLP